MCIRDRLYHVKWVTMNADKYEWPCKWPYTRNVDYFVHKTKCWQFWMDPLDNWILLGDWCISLDLVMHDWFLFPLGGALKIDGILLFYWCLGTFSVSNYAVKTSGWLLHILELGHAWLIVFVHQASQWNNSVSDRSVHQRCHVKWCHLVKTHKVAKYI